MSDQYFAVLKSYQRLMALGGATFDLETVTLRGELQSAYSLESKKLQKPRTTLRIHYLASKLSLIGENHNIKPGVSPSKKHTRALLLEPEPKLARGERYYVGKHYLGAILIYSPPPELQYC